MPCGKVTGPSVCWGVGGVGRGEGGLQERGPRPPVVSGRKCRRRLSFTDAATEGRRGLSSGEPYKQSLGWTTHWERRMGGGGVAGMYSKGRDLRGGPRGG